MKKLLSIILSISLLSGICLCAYAGEEITITNTEIKAENIPANGTIIAALYDKNNVLTGVRTYKGSEEKKYAADMSEEIKKSETIKVFVWNMETIEPLGRVYGDRLDNLPSEVDSNTMTVTINGKEFEAALENNDTIDAFKELLPMTINMNELNGNEKYYNMNSSLPTNSYSPGTINAGDIMLYGNNCLVVFYKTFSSSYSYTKIGHITDVTGIENAVGIGNAEITFKIDGIDD